MTIVETKFLHLLCRVHGHGYGIAFIDFCRDHGLPRNATFDTLLNGAPVGDAFKTHWATLRIMGKA